MSKPLFDGSDDSEEEIQLSTNKDYAKSFNSFRKKELLKKFKDRGYDVSESDSSSESESSEEEEVVDKKFDEEFFKTLASLKSKDPTIYDKNTRFFNDDDEDENEQDGNDSGDEKPKKDKQKPVTLKDYERKIILERGGKFEEDSDEDDVEHVERPVSPTIVEEERRLRAEFKKALEDDDDSTDEEFGGIFKKREKTKEEQDKEDEDFLKWLAGKKETINPDVKEKLEPLKNYWNNDKLPQSERFLRDYILNKGYANAKSSEIPTYDEIVGDNAPLSEDEEELEKQAEFEQKYNFRFEEPDSEFVKRFPRTIENSVRRTDDKRKLKRQEIKDRKQQEKEQKLRELELIKEMKRKEIEEKIQKLKLVTGNDELGFKDEELEEDFDPEAHDRRMKEIFNDEYYQVDEGEEKPDCPSDIDELKYEDWDNYNPNEGDYDDNEPHCEDDDFNMDCDYDPAAAKEQLQKELIENTKGKRKRKGRGNRFAELLKQEKPAFNPEDEKSYADYIDEYYKIDCEDFIGDLPCRFKYVETTPNDFGLTIEEILLAKNKELNQWASLKKAVQIRPDHIEKKEQRLFKLKAKNEELKRKIFKSLYGEGSDEEADEEEDENIVASKAEANKKETNANSETNSNEPISSKKSKKKRKRKAQAIATAENELKTENCDETSTEAKKSKPNENQDEKTPNNETPSVAQNPDQKKKKKRRKKKNPNPSSESGTNPSQATQQGEKKQTTTSSPKPNNPFNSTTQKTNQEKSPLLKKKDHSNHFKAKPKTDLQKSFQKNSSSLPKTNMTGTKSNPFKKTHTLNNETLPPTGRKLKQFSKKFPNKKPFKSNKTNSQDSKITDDRLKAYGINPRKFHKKQKYGNKQQQQK